MSLQIPKIDDRSYDQLVSEALARIPVHTPEWTNFNDSDPGVTLIQLFAFMTETLLYRVQLIPQRNRLKFLKLLGVSPLPASPARGFVTFSANGGSIKAQTVARELEVYAGKVPFQTRNGLDVLPVEAKVYYKSPTPAEKMKAETKEMYDQLYASFQSDGSQLDYYETKLLAPPVSGSALPVINLARDSQDDQGNDTLDGSLWIALLAKKKTEVKDTRKALGNRTLTLGIMPALSEAGRVLRPGGPASVEGQPNLVFQIPIGERLPVEAASRLARYKTLDPRFKGNVLVTPGVVEVDLPEAKELKLWDNLDPLEAGSGDFPPSLEDTDIKERLVTWVRIRVGEGQKGGKIPGQLSARLSWLGINAAMVSQCARVAAEQLGKGSGEPDQTLTLANKDIIPGSVSLTVNGQTWQQIDDLLKAGPEVEVNNPGLVPGLSTPSGKQKEAKVFTVDPEAGEICFGDGLRGARPPEAAVIRVGYLYGGGRKGNVGIGAINKGPALPAGLKVQNPLPTWGGSDAESVKQAEKLIPGYLRHRDRLISVNDFKEIVQRTPGVEPGRVEVLPLFHPDLPDGLSEGVVTVMVIPRYDSLHPNAPEPDRLFLDTICAYLNPRRVITTEVHLRGPEYISLWVSLGIDVIPGQDFAPVREKVMAAVKTFLSPLKGGFEAKGWPLAKAVEPLELMAVATRVEGVAKVNSLKISTAAATISHTEARKVEFKGLQLPRLAALSVQSGEAQAPEELRGDQGTSVPGGKPSDPISPKKVVTVPLIPPQCK
jgi:hypothetical protein